MKRIQLFEFEDQSFFPDSIRQCMTSYIVAFHRMVGSDSLYAPLIAEALKSTGLNKITDLCSGGGGCMPMILDKLAADHGMKPDVMLTDLYPNKRAAAYWEKTSPQIRYNLTSVDAGNVPPHLDGLRTMVCSFHHMPPPVARSILADAYQQKRPIAIFEISDNAPPIFLWWLPLLIGPIMVLFMTPFIRPLTWQQILFTYFIPILPFLIAWDGAASNARTYTLDDVKELLQGLEGPGYKWELGALSKKGYPAKLPYVIGLPAAS